MEPITALFGMLAAAAPMLFAGAIIFFILAAIIKLFLQLVGYNPGRQYVARAA